MRSLKRHGPFVTASQSTLMGPALNWEHLGTTSGKQEVQLDAPANCY